MVEAEKQKDQQPLACTMSLLALRAISLHAVMLKQAETAVVVIRKLLLRFVFPLQESKLISFLQL